MAIIKLQGKKEQEEGIYYEFNTATEPLGEGGMGKVYRGRKVWSDGRMCEVAIKFMFDGLPDTVIDRARREANIQIPHENLVLMMGFLTTETVNQAGEKRMHYHVVSELLTGVMLADLLQGVTATKSGEQIPFAQKLYTMYQTEREKFALLVMRNVLSGILTLHDHDYIHRDIDPTNIMVTKDGKIKLIDFGISKHLNTLATQDKALTSTGQFMGKAQYAAPELVLGDVPNQNKTTDIYELGILFYQLVAGHLPFEGTSNAILQAQLKTKTPVGDIENPYFANVIAKATEKEPKDRYQSAAEFRVAVEQLEPMIGRKRSFIDKLGKPLFFGGLAIVAAVVVAAVLLVTPWGGDTSYDDSRKATGREITSDLDRASMTMDEIRNILYSPASEEELKTAFESLEDRSRSGEADALYLLSRIYYKPLNPSGLSDSIMQIQLTLKGLVEQNNVTAHEYLMRAVGADPNHAKSLYELGLDYLAGQDRGVDRDLALSKKYFEKALKAASDAGDDLLASKAQAQLNNF